MAEQFSISEEHGLAAIPATALRLYSVGVSTAGGAEIRMAQANPDRRIIATTIDAEGVAYATQKVQAAGLSNRVQIKLEDVAQTLPYKDANFDFVYARLVLHYLPKQQLESALKELHRVLAPGGTIFVVVRSVNCSDAKSPGATFDPSTHMTTFTLRSYKGGPLKTRQRHFQTEQSITDYLHAAGFRPGPVLVYSEQLGSGFTRQKPTETYSELLEITATK